VVGLKARRNRHDFLQAQPEQGSTGEQNESESDLGDNEPMTQVLGRAADRA